LAIAKSFVEQKMKATNACPSAPADAEPPHPVARIFSGAEGSFQDKEY